MHQMGKETGPQSTNGDHRGCSWLLRYTAGKRWMTHSGCLIRLSQLWHLYIIIIIKKQPLSIPQNIEEKKSSLILLRLFHTVHWYHLHIDRSNPSVWPKSLQKCFFSLKLILNLVSEQLGFKRWPAYSACCTNDMRVLQGMKPFFL